MPRNVRSNSCTQATSRLNHAMTFRSQEARGLGLLSVSDRITMNRDRVVTDAKERALELLHSGYEPPQPRNDIPISRGARPWIAQRFRPHHHEPRPRGH